MPAGRDGGLSDAREADLTTSSHIVEDVQVKPCVSEASRSHEWKNFVSNVNFRLQARERGNLLAYVELQDPDAHAPLQSSGGGAPSGPCAGSSLSEQLDSILVEGESFWCEDSRIAVLLRGSMGEGALDRLRRIARRISSREEGSREGELHPTPAIGYVDLRLARTAQDLCDKAQVALDFAKSSLEIEPFRYTPRLSSRSRGGLLQRAAAIWGQAPQLLVLSAQLAASTVLALGVPFLAYAAFDALGLDISGPVYLGVVVVLVITSTTIWIEGFLALKCTEPPLTPGSPYPLATVIIPAYLPNEAATIVETVKAFLRLDYPEQVQLIIAYNSPGPRLPVEDELEALTQAEAKAGRFVIEPVRVQGSTSKAQNVNAVIGRVRGAFVGIYDADHHPLPDSLCRAWRWLSNGWDVVQGRCSIRNGDESWVARMVAIEFEQIYAVSHPGRARLHGFGIFGGSNGFWKTSVLHQTRMRRAMLTEDIDSSIRAVQAGFRIAGDRDLISEELAPTSLQQLLNQRLRWAQGWFQVSLKRILPVLASKQVTPRQKVGLLHLLVWRELFPGYSIQVVPILAYWVWIYGWSYIDWAVPIFLFTTIYTLSVGPGQLIFAYILSRKTIQQRGDWFLSYFFVSAIFYAPFKDTLSRIAHLKEAMRERAWKVTPRVAAPRPPGRLAQAALGSVALVLALVGQARAAEGGSKAAGVSPPSLAVLIGGEVTTIRAARLAAKDDRNAEAAFLFARAIRAVPRRRGELLREYADALTYSGRSREAVPLYREILAARRGGADRSGVQGQLALALGWSGQNQAAVAVYDDLLAGQPNDAGFILRRGAALVELGRDAEAQAALDRLPETRWAGGALGDLGDQILVGSARRAARTARHQVAVRLFERAIHHNAKLRAVVLQEYADQLLFSGHAAQAAALFREVLATSPASGARQAEASRGLARAAAEMRRPSVTGRFDLAQQNVLRARDAGGHADDRGDAANASREALFERALAAARLAAREDRNAEAATGFAAAIDMEPGRRLALVREYADQLRFSGRAAEALPLYQEALDDRAISSLDRRRALEALSAAYVALNRPTEAAATFAQLRRRLPGVVDVEWAEAASAARQAAREDRNEESSRLFATALALDLTRKSELLREYADQLSFSGKSDEAIAAYRQVVDDLGLSAADRVKALDGLAEAYDWSQRPADALSTYDRLLQIEPANHAAEWKRLVLTARQAARSDRNMESANLFFQAIRLDADRSDAVLREYADQLSFIGRAGGAIAVYQKALAQSKLSAADRLSTEKGLARAYDWSGRTIDAKKLFGALVAAHTEDADLQWRYLIVAAHAASKRDQNEEAATLFAQAIQLAPERRSEVLKEYADKLTFSNRSKQAVPLYRELLSESRDPFATKTRNLKSDLARALAWSDQFDAAIAEYRSLLRIYPLDLDVRVSLARALLWSGGHAAAEQVFQQVLRQEPGNAEGLRGLAQAEDWQGHHRIAQAILARRLAADPKDLEARRLLAQSQVWLGRPDKAADELKEGLQDSDRRLPPSRPAAVTNTIRASLSDGQALGSRE